MDGDAELDALRARRMAELQGRGGANDEERMRKQEENRKLQEDMKNSILSQVLSQEARARLNTIAIAKPEKARMVESLLVQMAQTGQIQSKLGEDQLKSLLEKVSEKSQKKASVKFDRRRAALDSDDD